MKHKQKSKEDIIREIKAATVNKNILIGGRVGLIIALAILIDVFEFTEEEVHEFDEKYAELMDSYNEGNEDPSKWVEILQNDYHLDIMKDLRSMI